MNLRQSTPAPAPERVISVTTLNRLARETLEAAFPLQWVAGEISNLTRAASGHLYLTLKDGDAQVRCTMWRNRAQLLAFRPENGMQVEVRALVSLYEARGDYQLNVETIRRAGLGNLYEAFLRLKARLEGEGLFDPAHKRALPRYPRGIAVVSSAQAAAWHDVRVALARRAPHVPLCLYPTPVQGEGAAARIAAAIATASARSARDGNDVLLLVRGGGSIEDLAAFNDEIVARAIRACTLPVVCGVGHETDVSIADFAADLRAATPTAAAELVSAAYADLKESLAALQARLRRALERRVENAAQRLDRAANRLVHPRQRIHQSRLELTNLAQRLDSRAERLVPAQRARINTLALRLAARQPDLQAAGLRAASLAARLERAAAATLQRQRSRLNALAQHLAHLDPRAVLGRGYSITRDADGRIVRSAAALSGEAQIHIEFHDGKVAAQVTPDSAPKPRHKD